MKWNKTSDVLPANGQNVKWLTSQGTEVLGKYHSNLWWLSNGMYIYYMPEFWKPA